MNEKGKHLGTVFASSFYNQRIVYLLCPVISFWKGLGVSIKILHTCFDFRFQFGWKLITLAICNRNGSADHELFSPCPLPHSEKGILQ